VNDADNFILPLSTGCSFVPQVSRTHPRFRHASLQTGFASGAYLPPKARALEPCLPWPKQLLPQTFDITKHRIIKYGQSEHSDGCLHGSYLHTLECRQRFNRCCKCLLICTHELELCGCLVWLLRWRSALHWPLAFGCSCVKVAFRTVTVHCLIIFGMNCPRAALCWFLPSGSSNL